MIDGEQTPEQLEAFLGSFPLGRYDDPDIGGAAVFFASDLAGYVTGESLVVEGGRAGGEAA